MTYLEAEDFICTLLKFGVRPGLTGMNALLHFLDNPEKDLQYVHVAGTNGKGSVSSAISNVLSVAGYKVGLYTSPYVTHSLERIQLNGELVDEAVFAKCVETVKTAVETLQCDDVQITEFEALTATAFLCFKELGCDVVVLEVGMGGTLDATNVIPCPLVNVITSISLDHTGFLGETIKEVARHKCGTLKECCKAVVSCDQLSEVMSVVDSVVSSLKGSYVVPYEGDVEIIKSDLYGTEFIYKNERFRTSMSGIHQVQNMLSVIEACEILKDNFKISLENIKCGISKTILPARVEVLCSSPLVVLDGGHNKEGAEAFFGAVKPELSLKNRVIVVAGMMADKAVEESLTPLMKVADEFYAVSVENSRSMSGEALSEIAQNYCNKAYAFEGAKAAIDTALSDVEKNDAILIVGSLYLAREVRSYVIEKLQKFN